jgi:hypothetical protein
MMQNPSDYQAPLRPTLVDCLIDKVSGYPHVLREGTLYYYTEPTDSKIAKVCFTLLGFP